MSSMILFTLLAITSVWCQGDATGEVADLIKQFGQEETRFHAYQSLLDIGPSAVPQLVQAVRHGSGGELGFSFIILMAMEDAAVPPLVSALREEPEAEARVNAAAGLGLLATHAFTVGFRFQDGEPITDRAADRRKPAVVLGALQEHAVPALVRALDDVDAQVRASALEAVACIGPEAIAALPRLIDLMKDEDSRLGETAVTAIGQFGVTVRPTIEQLLDHRNEVVRERASAVLTAIRVVELIDQLEDWQRVDVVLELVQIGPPVVLPLLRQVEEEWVPAVGMYQGPKLAHGAEKVLTRLGVDAIPPLITALERASPPIRRAAAEHLGRLGDFTRNAERAFIRAEETGKTAPMIQGIELQSVATLKKALAEQAVPVLKATLTASDARLRKQASVALAKIRGPTIESLPGLIVRLQDVTDSSGHLVSHAIAKLGAVAVPDVIELLDHEDAKVRGRALGTLRRMRKEAIAALPALIHALSDPDSGNRYLSAQAILELGREGAPALGALRDLLDDPEPFVAAAAASAIGRIAPDSNETLELVVAATEAYSAHVRLEAVKSVGELGPKAKDAIPHLLDLLQDEDWRVRSQAAEAIRKIGAPADEVLAQLTVTLSDENPMVREAAVLAVRFLGPYGAPAIPVLIGLTKDRSRHVQAAAAFALGAIGSASDDVLDALMVAIHSHEFEVRAAAMYSLSRLGPAAANGAMPFIITGLQDKHLRVRRAAATALGTIGPDAIEAIPALREAMTDEHEGVRDEAKKALSKIDPNWKAK